jgi:hypothetical protein
MTDTIENARVNPGSSPAEELVEVTFHLPASVWDSLKGESVSELKTTDDIVALALQEHFQGIKDADIFEGHLGVPVEELTPIIHLAAWKAALDFVEEHGEITVPPKFVLVPSGCAPMFLSERTVRYARECCAIIDVDADEWVEGWIGEGHIEMGLNGRSDVTFAGIAADLVENYGERSLAENQALYEKFREVAFRYQQEVKQEAAASTEGGEA